MSDLDLLLIELGVLWQLDSRRRISGPPELVVAAAADGLAAVVSHDIPDSVVESLLELKPSPYVQSLSPNRFSDSKWTWAGAQASAARIYAEYYGLTKP